MKFEVENNKYFTYALTFFVLLGGIINLLIGMNNYSKNSKIIKRGTKIEATIKNEIQNNFGEFPSYKYEIEYFFKKEKYFQINDGIFKTGHYKIGQKIEIIVDVKNPIKFTDLSNVHFKNNFIISFACFLIFAILIVFKKTIILFLDQIS